MNEKDLQQIVFMDIETVARQPELGELPEEWQEMFRQKTTWQKPELTTWEDFYKERAAILSEFGQIVCISVGYFNQPGDIRELRVKSYFGKNEKLLLQQFFEEVGKLVDRIKNGYQFCGHNLKEFDIPYLCRRSLINEIPLPEWMNIFRTSRSWEHPVIDTLQAWRFGDYKNYTSLNLLAACLGIPSPKTDLDGSKVGHTYWVENDLPRIAAYCQKDVITCARILQRMHGLNMLTDEEIVEVGSSEITGA